MTIVCEFCGNPVDPRSPSTKQYGSGWAERNRRGGGAHGLSLARWTNRFAHTVCVDAVRHNDTLGQLDFLTPHDEARSL